MDIKNLTNQVLDLPKMIGGKLPWNNWNSCVEDSENSIAEWIGKIFSIGALALLVALIWGTLSPMWNGGFDGKEALDIVAMLIGTLLWVYAAFPIAQIVRNTGDGIASSKSGIIHLIFLDLPVALIKLAGYVLAMVGLFAAIATTLSFITTLDIAGGVGSMVNGLAEMSTMGTTALFDILSNTPVAEIGDAMNQMMNAMAEMGSSVRGEAWTMPGAMGVFASFVAVLVTLINLYINVVIYQFLFGLVSTLVNWVKGPYLPFKSL
jgi:hypothetical protein